LRGNDSRKQTGARNQRKQVPHVASVTPDETDGLPVAMAARGA